MTGGPPDDDVGSTGPPDRHTLRLLERRLADDPLVAETVLDPDPYEPRVLRASLDLDRYPEEYTAARVDVRWFATGDFSFHYVEDAIDSDRWECRWDRHPNAHDPRLHFHRPPDGEIVIDLELDSIHPLDVYATVLTAVERRIEDLWSD